MAKAMVTPKEFMKRPTMPPMKATGRKTAISESDVARTASAISPVPWAAASRGESFFSSRNRKTFSSTTTASSMTMPTTSASARRVMTLSVKPMYCIAAKVAMREVGMATAAMIVSRKRRRNKSTVAAAKSEPRSRCSLTASTAAVMYSDWSRAMSIFQPLGSWLRSCSIRSFSRLMTSIVLVPDCFRTWRMTAGLPSTLAIVSASAWPSSTRATSRSFTG